ncbi:hypothetical protein [Mesorhizobium sp. CAU 1741]|uniref:hypothetical protein n=1 Tax=Mesorhizobium sp. CAU 1741 TaxID=3140366 RepID=UPI00325B0355
MSGSPAIIPFGVDTYPSDAAGGEAMAFPHIPAGAVEGKTLRMNAQRFALPALPQDLSVDGQAHALLAHLCGLCGTWDQTSRAFLAGYFDHLRFVIDEHRPAIEARLAVFDHLFSADDTIFSAPMPLPRAHLLPPEDGRGAVADIALRISTGWLALFAAPGRLMPAQARAREQRYEAAGIRTIDFTLADTKGGPAFFSKVLGDDEPPFWQAETLPSGLAFTPLRF